MDGTRFDRVARALAGATSRRDALKILIGGTAALTVANRTYTPVFACQAGGGGCQGSAGCTKTGKGSCANPCCANNVRGSVCLGDNGNAEASGRCGSCKAGTLFCGDPNSNSGVCCPTTASCNTATSTCSCGAGFEFCGSGSTQYMSCCPAGTCNTASGACNCPAGQVFCGGVCCPSGTSCGAGNICQACVGEICGGQCVVCAGGMTLDTATCQCQCPAGQTDCGGTCIDLSTGTVQGDTTTTDCGACGNTCSAGNACSGGVCECVQDADCTTSTNVCNTTTSLCACGATSAATNVCNTATSNYCNTITNSCVCGSETAAAIPTDCSTFPDRPYCKDDATPTSATCVECLEDANCSGGDFCDLATNTCQPCIINQNCTTAAETICVQGSGSSKNSCARCAVSSDCTGDSDICDTSGSTSICVCGTGVNAAACGGATPYCFAGEASSTCVECLQNDNCPSGQYCSTSNTCVSGCKKDSDCSGDANWCDTSQGICVCGVTESQGAFVPCSGTRSICVGATSDRAAYCSSCSSDSDCTGASNRCDLAEGQCVCGDETNPDGKLVDCTGQKSVCSGASGSTNAICVECENNGDCPNSTPVCSASGSADATCVECENNGDCPNSTPVCDTRRNTCQQCVADSDCSRDSICRNGRCDSKCAHAGERLSGKDGRRCCDRLHLEKGRCVINRWDHCDPRKKGHDAFCERGTRCVGGNASPHKTPVCVPDKKRRKPSATSAACAPVNGNCLDVPCCRAGDTCAPDGTGGESCVAVAPVR